MITTKQTTSNETVIAGHLVRCNRPLPIVQDRPARGEAIQFLFYSETDPAWPADLNGTAGEEWHQLAHFSGVQAYLRADGRQALIREATETAPDYAALVRFFLPFCSALQGFLIIHASAVQLNDAALAFVGASGAGKSTIATSLLPDGFQFVADDLLPISVAGGGIYIFGAASDQYAQQQLPLRALHFIERDPALDQPQFTRLGQQEALLALLRHGFGELPDTAVWRTQFIVYGRVAREVPAWSLQLPDNRAKLPATMQKVAQELRQFDKVQAAVPVEVGA